MRTLTHRRRAGLAALAALALGGGLLAVPAAASATPAPDAGPTRGGTALSNTADLGMTFTKASFFGDSPHGGSAIDSAGKAWAWGPNTNGMLGDGSFNDSNTPVLVDIPEGVTAIQVAMSNSHAMVVGSDGNIYTWGQNSRGQLGTNSFLTVDPEPAPVVLPAGVTSFHGASLASFGAIALGDDGNTYAWGQNNRGQLGNGSTTDSWVPALVQAPAGVTFVKVQAGESHTVGLGDNGTVYTWGYNNYGQLGKKPSGGYDAVPAAVPSLTGVTITDVAVTRNSTLALGGDGKLYAWGRNNYGQLGDGATGVNSSTPVLVETPTGVTFTNVFSGGDTSYALGDDGMLYAWGLGNVGQLGTGSNSVASTPARVQAPDGVTFNGVTGSNRAVTALGSDGVLYVWGRGATATDMTGGESNVPVVFAAVEVETVSFRGLPGTNLVQSSMAPGPVTWSVDTPPGCGPVDVVMSWTQFGVEHEESFPDGFVYGAAPTEASVTPASQEVEWDGTFTATATADGDDAPTFQWQEQLEDGSWAELAGETSNTLTIEGVREDSVYRVVAQNCWGADTAVISDPVTLTVGDEPPTPPGGGNGGGAEAGKGSGNELWLAGTGSDLLWLGVALATAATVCGALLLSARRRHTP